MSFKKPDAGENLTNDRMSDEELSQMRASILNDFSVLKPNIDFSQFGELVPQRKKNQKNETPSVSQLKSRLNEIVAKVSEMNDQNKEEQVDNVEWNEAHLDNDHINRLQLQLPTFKLIVNQFTENCEKHSINQTDSNGSKIIDVNNEQIDRVLRTTELIQHFQSCPQILKSLENRK